MGLSPPHHPCREGELGGWVGKVEFVPNPRQYRRWGLSVCVCEDGIYRPLAYNRRGLVGDFLVLRFSRDGEWLDLTGEHARAVSADLADVAGGYLSDDCQTLSPFREPFKRYGIPPSGAIPEEGRWFI